MAEKVTYTVSGKLKRGTDPLLDLVFGKQNLTLDLTTGAQYARNTGTASTSNEALPLGDVPSGEIGVVVVANHSPTLEITVGADATNQPILLGPKSYFFSPKWNGTSVNVKAVSGAPPYEYFILQR